MSDNTEDLKVRITTEAAGTGAKDTARDLDKVNESAKHGAEGADTFSEAIEHVGTRNNAAHETFEGLERATQGGVAGLFGAAKAAKGFIEVIKGLAAGGFGPIITAITAVVAIGALLKEKFFSPAEEGFKDTSEEAKKTTETIGELEKVKLKFDAQKKELQELTDGFEHARAKADALFKAEEALKDAELGKKIAQIDLEKNTAIRNAGGDPAKEKEAELNAEAKTTSVRAARDIEKAAAASKKNDDEIVSLKEQQKAQLKKAAEIEQTALNEQDKYLKAKAQAEDVGVKSDQQRALDELAQLKKEEAAEPKYIASLREAGLFQQAAARENSPDLNRRRRIEQLERQRPELEETLNKGGETYSEEQASRKEAAARLEKEAEKDPDNKAKSAAALGAQKAAEASEELPKLEAGAKEAKKQLEELPAVIKKIKDISDQIEQKTIDKKTLKTEAETTQIKGKSDTIKVTNDIDEENRKRLAAQAAQDLQEKQRQDQLSAAKDQSFRATPFSDEENAANKKVDALQNAAPTQQAPGLLNIKPVDTKPIGDSVQSELIPKITTAFSETESSIKTTADSIDKAASKIPPAPDFASVGENFTKYHGQVVDNFKDQQKQIDTLNQSIDRFAQQLANLQNAVNTSSG